MRFQHFEIKSDERRLLIANEEATIGARAFDLLVALATRHGQVVSKQTLLDVVWPDLVVEENNLQVQISTLRKLLGAHAITTMPGRGYCLSVEPIGSFKDIQESRPAFENTQPPPSQDESNWNGNLPTQIAQLYGRQIDVQRLCELLNEYRLLTITGSGGMGKTHITKTVAAAKRDAWRDGVWWIDVTAVQNEASLIQSLAECFRIGLLTQNEALNELAEALAQKQLLLILDNCEHLVHFVGPVVTALLERTTDVQILITSQARLHVAGEYVFQLSGLSVPDQSITPQEAMQYGAVHLFVERVQQLDQRFVLSDSTLPSVSNICKQLDGVALAIELAAARVPMLGVQGVEQRLGERLKLLGNRQATMRATLDWSHRLLGATEAAMFRRLGVFVSSFSLDAAKRLLCDEHLDEWDMLSQLESLVHNSLVVVTDDEPVRYRMLETHRFYALEKLEEAGEFATWQQRLAHAMVSLCRHLVKTRSTNALWGEIDHIRAAYDWATQQEDKANHEIAIALATASAMLLLVSGYAHEASTRLLKVEPWVDHETPQSIAARYWQWLGRSGVHGRIATLRCIDAFIKSEKIFQSLNDWRHVHACRRMRAEALLDNGQPHVAKIALLEAQAMETPDWPVADRMRRLKVQSMLAVQMEQHKTALRLAEQALTLAQMGNIERYIIAIQLDIANLHLTMDRQDDALKLYRLITSQDLRQHYHRVTVAEAYVGYATILLDANDPFKAAKICLQALPLWRSSGLFIKQGDIMARWLANAGLPLLATQMLVAANTFFLDRELKRDAIGQRNYDHTWENLVKFVSKSQLENWMDQSKVLIDEQLLANSYELEIVKYLKAYPSSEVPNT